MVNTNVRKIPELFLSWFEAGMFPGVSISPYITHPDVKASVSEDISQTLIS